MTNLAISCSTAAERISGLLDGGLEAVAQRETDTHLEHCPACAQRFRQIKVMRSTMRRMPVRNPPSSLTTRLRVVASREVARQNKRSSFPALWAHCTTRLSLWFQNLMRPLAIPTAGGFLSAVALFCLLPLGMISPSLALSVATISDVPTGLYTGATVKSSKPVGFDDEDVVVELTIDDQGQILSYTIPDCPHLLRTPALRRTIESSLLFTQFTPATTFGQPRPSKIRLSFRNSSINVKG